MSIRGLVIALLLMATLGLAWQQREPLQAWLGTSATRVQSLAATSTDSPAAAGAAMPKARPGGLRKCTKGQQITYTNEECPPGYRDQAVTAAPVNVVPATPVAQPAAAGSGPASLRQALDMTRDDKLKDKLIERAVEAATR